jgi:hypothetical protein
MQRTAWIALGTALGLASSAGAEVSEEEAARLGRELTPVGAEPGGNADGSIPAWTGGLREPPKAWKPGGPRVDPFADDEPLFSIDSGNLARYQERLSPGQLELFRRHEGYRMDVYPTRRSCAYPEWIYEATRRNATSARLREGGIYLDVGWHAYLFPIPKSGAEAIWNHQYAYFTEGKIEYYATLVPTKTGDMEPVHTRITYDAHMFDPNVKSLDEAQGRSASVIVERLAPPRLAGQVVLVHEMVNDQRRGWIYNPGQRRVRRAPTVAYDNPLAGTESLMTNDQVRMLNGLIDRFDWKLVGKRELYIPANVFRLNHERGLGMREAFGPRYPRRDLVRYELHRVWVVEATLKPGKRHLFSKRVFYLDEDSWLAALEDIYDKGGNLWRVMEGMLTVIPEVPTCQLEGTITYDLVAGRYAADQVKTEQPPDDWLAGREDRISKGAFTPDALRRIGRR